MLENGSQSDQRVGNSVRRAALDRFVSGRGCYIADVAVPNVLAVHFVRSTVPHARLRSVDTEAACATSGVITVITGADMAALGAQPSLWDLPGQRYSNLKALAVERLLYVGHPYAAIVAVDAEAARAAADLITLDCEPLPFHLTIDEAADPSAVRLFDHWPDNVVGTQHWSAGDVDAAFASASTVVSDRFTSQRVLPCSIEGRGVIAVPDTDGMGVTVHTSTQSIHQVRAAVSGCLDLPEHRIRVIAHDVGGAFGMKACAYGEETVLALLATRLQRPVRWIETRREAFVGSTHGRDEQVDLEVAFDSTGRILGLRGAVMLDKGGDPYATSFGTSWITGALLSGPYRVSVAAVSASAVVTNKTPTGAYRGYGQPEANFALERVLDIAAHEIGIDPAELRRRNLVSSEEMPFTIFSGVMLDSGRYADLLDATLERFGYEDALDRAARIQGGTKALGIGIACYSEVTNFGPSPMCAVIGVNSGGFDTTNIRMEPSGHVRLFISQTPMGQGIETSLAQICADTLHMPVEDVNVVHGDTMTASYTAYASGGSRGAGVAGATARIASERLAQRLVRWGAHLLQAAEDEVELSQGGVQVIGEPVRRVSVGTIAAAAYRAASVPEGLEPGLEDRATYDPPALAVAYGSVAVEVSVDLETGQTKVERMTFGHDCGTQINPKIVDGQVTGGIAQAIGATLYEHMRYDEAGHPVSLSLRDYLLPLASDVPTIDLLHFTTPSPFSPMGAKGVGESGTIPVPAAIANAVQHAIRGVTSKRLTSLPLSAEAVLEAMAG